MPRHTFRLVVRTLSRGIAIRYIHLPPRILPVSMPQSRRMRIMPITPRVVRYTNRRAYCDDLSGNSTFSGNWTYDLHDSDDLISSSSTTPSTSPPLFWSKLPDYSSAFQESHTEFSERLKSRSATRSRFSDADLETINETAAAVATTTNSSSNKSIDEAPRIIQKTVGEITRDIRFPDPDVWRDSPSSANSTTYHATESAVTDSTSLAIAKSSREASDSPAKNI